MHPIATNRGPRSSFLKSRRTSNIISCSELPIRPLACCFDFSFLTTKDSSPQTNHRTSSAMAAGSSCCTKQASHSAHVLIKHHHIIRIVAILSHLVLANSMKCCTRITVLTRILGTLAFLSGESVFAGGETNLGELSSAIAPSNSARQEACLDLTLVVGRVAQVRLKVCLDLTLVGGRMASAGEASGGTARSGFALQGRAPRRTGNPISWSNIKLYIIGVSLA